MLKKKQLLGILQVVVSLAALSLLAYQVNLADAWHAMTRISFSYLLLAFLLMGLGFLAATLRWRALLNNFSMTYKRTTLFGFYLKGLFLSQLLPTNVGGDVYRVFAIKQLGCPFPIAFFATLQERVLGLAAALFMGGFPLILFWNDMPCLMAWGVLLVQCASIAIMFLVLYPTLAERFIGALHRAFQKKRQLMSRLLPLEQALEKFHQLLAVKPQHVLRIILLGCSPVVALALSYKLLFVTLDVPASFAFLLLIIPLVWVVRLMPIALGGIGIGESAFVILANMQGIPHDQAFAVALILLIIQLLWAGLGGLLFAHFSVMKLISRASSA